MSAELFCRELRCCLRTVFTPLILSTTVLMTYLRGAEFASRQSLSAEAQALGLSYAGQEWAFRSLHAPLCFFAPLAALAVVASIRREEKVQVAEILASKPMATTSRLTHRLAALSTGLLLQFISGLGLGTLATGLLTGLWVEPGLTLQAFCSGILPGLLAWILLMVALAHLGDLRALLFPLITLW